jgi:Protein of unknown function (DUF2752)
LHSWRGIAIVRPPLILTEADPRTVRESVKLRLWVRLGLVLLAGGLMVVFAIAIWLNPYKDGHVWLQETHKQLGLPPCTFKSLTGVPCPSCGMTSSFSLLMHGDLWNSLRANFVGTLLALFGLAFVPWALVSVIRGKLALIRSVEYVLVRLVLVFVTLLLLRWGMVLLLIFYVQGG